jgi:mono/diheme cytochrome c family protein
MTKLSAAGLAVCALALSLATVACQGPQGDLAPAGEPDTAKSADAAAPITATQVTAKGGMAGKGGRHAAMMRMHQQPVPVEYRGMTSPTEADEAALARGRTIYDTYCALCHGQTGQGDGPSAVTLDPPPAPLAISSARMGDDYLFWRISEGGTHFGTGMPVWKAALSDAERWDVIHYMRDLANASAAEGTGSNAQAAMDRMHDAMLEAAQTRGLITSEEAALFRRVHPFVDRFNADEATMMAATVAEKKARQRDFAALAIGEGLISQADADAFTRIHDILIDAGIMP